MCFVIAHLVLLLTARRDRNIRKEFVFLQAQISYAGALTIENGKMAETNSGRRDT